MPPRFSAAPQIKPFEGNKEQFIATRAGSLRLQDRLVRSGVSCSLREAAKEYNWKLNNPSIALHVARWLHYPIRLP